MFIDGNSAMLGCKADLQVQLVCYSGTLLSLLLSSSRLELCFRKSGSLVCYLFFFLWSW